MLRAMLSHILEAVFPTRCASCAKLLTKENRAALLCEECAASVDLILHPRCPACGARCVAHRPRCHPKASFVLISPASYGSASVRALIHALKYQGIRSACNPLATFLAKALIESATTLREALHSYTLVPVPLHPRRLRARGFNHAAMLAQKIQSVLEAEGVTVALELDSVARIRHTPPQSDLEDDAAREVNVRNAFALRDPRNFENRNVILVDDVFTSGATTRELVRVLKRAGARRIIVLTAASRY